MVPPFQHHYFYGAPPWLDLPIACFLTREETSYHGCRTRAQSGDPQCRQALGMYSRLADVAPTEVCLIILVTDGPEEARLVVQRRSY
jgi:hypothetical protein